MGITKITAKAKIYRMFFQLYFLLFRSSVYFLLLDSFQIVELMPMYDFSFRCRKLVKQ